MKYLGIFMVLCIAIYTYNHWGMEEIEKNNTLYGEQLKINKNCPFMIDNNIRLDSVAYSSISCDFYFTFVNVTKSETNIEYLKNEVYKYKKQELKTNNELKNLKETNCVFKLLYRDKNSDELFKINFTSADYN